MQKRYTHLQHFSTSITIVDADDVNDDVWISIRLRDLRQRMYLARDYYLYGNTFTSLHTPYEEQYLYSMYSSAKYIHLYIDNTYAISAVELYRTSFTSSKSLILPRSSMYVSD